MKRRQLEDPGSVLFDEKACSCDHLTQRSSRKTFQLDADLISTREACSSFARRDEWMRGIAAAFQIKES